jgi:hypothetical protein
MRIIYLFLGLSVSIFADSFYLKDGKTVNGTLIEQSERYFIYRDGSGIVKTIPRGDVRNIVPGDNPKNVITEAEDSDASKNKGASPKTSEEKNVTIDISHEVVSDFIWRGINYGSDFLARRNNTRYKEVGQYWAYQPNIRVEHTTGLYLELWGNISLVGRGDRDSDMRLQSSPGGNSIDAVKLADRIAQGNFTADAAGTSALFDPSNNVQNSSCADPAAAQAAVAANPGAINDCFVNITKVKKYKEKNGMSRTDGLFTTFAYKMDGGNLGTFTMGTWWYFQNDRNAKYSWNEYFIWWDLPLLKGILDPSIQAFTQSSYDSGGSGAGNQYVALVNKHTFFTDKPYKIEVTNNVGYQWVNNNTSQKSGILDITSGIKFFLNQFFVSLNHAHRPNVYMYDNGVNFFTLSNSNPATANRSEYDGKTVDPSKLYGTFNDLVYQSINELQEPDIVKLYLKEQYQNQNIPKNLYWVSIGFNQSF